MEQKRELTKEERVKLKNLTKRVLRELDTASQEEILRPYREKYGQPST